MSGPPVLTLAEVEAGRRLVAPWTSEQIAALNDYRELAHVHPYTCPEGGCGRLVAFRDGWHCLSCEYRQAWAWEDSADRASPIWKPPFEGIVDRRPPPGLYSPPDVHDAHDAWGANCGPCALAACLKRTLAGEIFRAFAPFFGYTTPTAMKAAIRRLDRSFTVVLPEVWDETDSGIAFVQWEGPWEASERGAYRFTHWIAYYRDKSALGAFWIYDVNAGVKGAWMPMDLWQEIVVPEILPKRATGWRFRLALEVRPAGAAI